MKYFHNSKRVAGIYVISAVATALIALAGLALGSTGLSLGQLLSGMLGKSQLESNIFWYVRFPRVAASLLCGGALALSGAVIQAVLANRLASPSIIGVNSGAGLAVTLCFAFGVTGGWRLSAFAFLGAFCTVMAVSAVAKKWGASRGTVILIGVALNSLLGGLSDGVTTFFPDVAIMRTDFKIGDFSAVTYSRLIPAAVVILVATVIIYTLCNQLDVITLGDDSARGLGMNVTVMRPVLLMLCAALAGAAVSVAGLISFVGLLVPHAVRALVGSRSCVLLPLCALLGGGFVTLCDTLARWLFSPYELPVGIIMAFLGAPFFLFVLFKGKGGHSRG